MTSIIKANEKIFSMEKMEKLEEINNYILVSSNANDDNDSNYYDEVEKTEFKKYSTACDDWEEEMYDQIYYDEIPLKKSSLYPPTPLDNYQYFEPLEESESPMFTLGTVLKTKEKRPKKISFKFANKPIGTFCLSLINEKKKCPPKCTSVHDFQQITFCGNECGRVKLNNGLYTGVCNKKHSRETLDNYLLRKGIKLINKNNISLQLYEKPTDEQLRFIITTCKTLKYKVIDIEVVPRPLDISDFYNEFNSSEYSDDDF